MRDSIRKIIGEIPFKESVYRRGYWAGSKGESSPFLVEVVSIGVHRNRVDRWPARKDRSMCRAVAKGVKSVCPEWKKQREARKGGLLRKKIVQRKATMCLHGLLSQSAVVSRMGILSKKSLPRTANKVKCIVRAFSRKRKISYKAAACRGLGVIVLCVCGSGDGQFTSCSSDPSQEL